MDKTISSLNKKRGESIENRIIIVGHLCMILLVPSQA